MGVSVVIPTLNEVERLPKALESVNWCDEIYIVDSHSTDGTRKLAREYGAQVIDAPKTDPDEPYDHFRRLGIDAASNDLILFIDADERHPVTLQKRLQEIAEQPPKKIGIVRAPVLQSLGDTTLNGGKYYEPVLFNRDAMTIRERVHSFMQYDDDDAYNIPYRQELCIRHELAPSLFQHWKDQRRYAMIAGTNRDFNPLMLLLAPPWGFYHKAIEEQRWRDGPTGIGIALCYSWFLLEANFRSLLSLEVISSADQ